MWKQNKWKIIISSIVILLPILLGICLWDQLPAQMVTHWGIDGQADGMSSSAVFVFLSPCLLLLFYWLGLWITSKDKKNMDQNPKAFSMIFWIMPIISLFSNGIIYATAFGMEFNIAITLPIFMGILFIIIGNYLPKCKQNLTLGIKIKWTLENEENWNATHRFAGKIWVIGGLCILFFIFLPAEVMMPATVVVIFPMVLIPTIYSYLYAKKQHSAGTYTVSDSSVQKLTKKSLWLVIPVSLSTVIFVAILLFTGSVSCTFEEDSFTADCIYWNALTVEYDAIDSIEYREDFKWGSRISGFGSPKLSVGSFKNKELGNYTLYAYTKCDDVVIVRADDKVLVIGGKTTKDTKLIYETLLKK